MKVTNGEVFAAKEPLDKLLIISLPVKPSYQLARMARKLLDARQPIEVVRNKLVKEYGAEAEGRPGVFTVAPGGEHWDEFVSKVNELMAEEVEVDATQVVLPSKDWTVDAATLMALEKFVTLEEPAKNGTS